MSPGYVCGPFLKIGIVSLLIMTVDPMSQVYLALISNYLDIRLKWAFMGMCMNI